MTERTIRCAIYTRKSSEEGLEQSFNSIDAQREACEAYVVSQRHEGWITLATRYDDGGFSGGNLDRPAMQRLLADIRAGQIDLVIVYKIDRLTRSLADFAKMVETFDAHQASFVSVTQHFNTTTSMGRLTLNVLLSFAQFEREVTGERIRDKIAASKRKGMWMGGVVPLGYDATNRKLVVNPTEAALVRRIYALYLEAGNVRLVQAQLKAEGAKSKGGAAFMPGAIFKILNNRTYLGETRHKDSWYPGEHDAVLETELFDQVQGAIALRLDRRRKGLHAKEPSLLASWVSDGDRNVLIPTHATKKGKRYRYYISRPTKDAEQTEWAPGISVPAHDLEQLVIQAISRWLANASKLIHDLQMEKLEIAQQSQLLTSAENYAEKLRQGTPHEQRALLLPIMNRIQVHTGEVKMRLMRHGCLKALGLKITVDETEDRLDEQAPMIVVAARMKRYGMEMRLIVTEEWARVEEPEVDPHLVMGLARAHAWWNQLKAGEVRSIAELADREKVSADFVSKVLRGAWVAPDLMELMLEGRAPGWSSKRLLEPRSMLWSVQKAEFNEELAAMRRV